MVTNEQRGSLGVEKGPAKTIKVDGGMQNLTYEERLRRSNIFSLEMSRLRGDMITIYIIYLRVTEILVSSYLRGGHVHVEMT